jgi:hypothetical protein
MSTSPAKAIATPPAAFLSRMAIDTERWNADLALWEAKAEEAGPAARAELHSWQHTFHAERAEVQQRMAALEGFTHHSWDEVQVPIEAAWSELGAAFEGARLRFA